MATNLEARAPQLKMLGEPKGVSEIFPRAQPCSPVVIGSMIPLRAIVECGSAFFEDISKGMQILVNYPILLTYMVVILINIVLF